MRAWLLLLAVLATFQPIVQVASTEDISLRFIKVITPSKMEHFDATTTTTATTQNRNATERFHIGAEKVEKATESTQSTKSKKSSTTTTTTKSISSTVISSSAFIYANSDSNISNNTNKENVIIKLKGNEHELHESGSNDGNTSDNQLENQQNSRLTSKSESSTPTFTGKVEETTTEVVQQNKEQMKTHLSVYATQSTIASSASTLTQSPVTASSTATTATTTTISTHIPEEHGSVEDTTVRDQHNKHHQHHRHHQHLHQQNSEHHQQQHKHHHHHHHHHHQQQHQQQEQKSHNLQQQQDHHSDNDTATVAVTHASNSVVDATHAEQKLKQENEVEQETETEPEQETETETEPEQETETEPEQETETETEPEQETETEPEQETETKPQQETETETEPQQETETETEPEQETETETEPATYSNKEIIGEKIKPDPSTLVEIENSLLSLFNMKRPPKIDRSKIIIPETMKQLYAQIMGHELDSVNIPKAGLLTKSANTVRSFTHQDSKIDDRFPNYHRFRLHFDITSIPAEEKLKAAELQVTRDAISDAALNPRLANRTRYQVLVYDITRVGVRGKREPSYLLLDNKTIRLNSTSTISLDVQPAVDRWLASPKKNYGLLVEVRTMRSLKPAPHHHVRLRRRADEPHADWQHKQPLLFTYTDDGRHKSRSIRDVSTRSKRAGHHRRSHRRKNNEEICRRHSLYVDFNDVGWSDWIVAPPGYDAFYCHGKCPFPLADHLNSTNHAVVQTLVNSINPGKVPKACCVPTQLEGISMLYLNDQRTVVLKNYQDMTVVGCGCR